MNYDDINLDEIQVPEFLDIPDDLLLPIQNLIGLGYMFRGVFMQAVYGKSLSEIIVGGLVDVLR